VIKFSAVLHPTGCFRYILGFRGGRQFAEWKTTLFLVRHRQK